MALRQRRKQGKKRALELLPISDRWVCTMERAWSTRTHEHVRDACTQGSAMVDQLAKQSGECAQTTP